MPGAACACDSALEAAKTGSSIRRTWDVEGLYFYGSGLRVGKRSLWPRLMASRRIDWALLVRAPWWWMSLGLGGGRGLRRRAASSSAVGSLPRREQMNWLMEVSDWWAGRPRCSCSSAAWREASRSRVTTSAAWVATARGTGDW